MQKCSAEVWGYKNAHNMGPFKKIILASCTRVRRSLHASFFGSSYKHTAEKVDKTTDL